MNKLKQAIAYFEDVIRESDEIVSNCSEALQKELTKQIGIDINFCPMCGRKLS